MAMLLLLLLLAMRLILANTCQLTSCLVLVVAPVARRLHLPQTHRERERETKTELTVMETETATATAIGLNCHCDCVFWGVCLVCCLPTCNNMRHAPFELALSLTGTAAYSSAKCLHDCLHNCLIAEQISNVSLRTPPAERWHLTHVLQANKKRRKNERGREGERFDKLWTNV